MFALAWTYLIDRVVARAYHKGKNSPFPEWPVHPDRVFQALVASWGNLGEPPEGIEALEWLEKQDLPVLFVPENETIPEDYTVFVPTNDRKELPKKRVPRNFPSVLLPQQSTDREERKNCSCALIWEKATPSEGILETMERLCDGVTHIGHSRSLVHLRITHNPPESNWRPATENSGNGEPLRVPHKGRLRNLCKAYAGGGERWQRPPEAPYKKYIKIQFPLSDLKIYQGDFSSRLIILRKIQGDLLSLPQTLAFTEAFRGTLLKNADPMAKEIVSGHDESGTPHESSSRLIFSTAFCGKYPCGWSYHGFCPGSSKRIILGKRKCSLEKPCNSYE